MKVLVVDDEEVIRVVLGELLEALGLEVVIADSAGAGLRAIQEDGDISLIFLDHNMPGQWGGEMAKTIKQDFPQKIVILMSGGMTEEEGESVAQAAGADQFIAKPFRLGDLREVFNNFFG